MKPARVVLDTNVVVSALLFGRGRLAWLRRAWQTTRFVPLIDHDTADELIRVLGYPKFQLTRAEQTILLTEYLPFAETAHSPAKRVVLPGIRDPADRKFLALAHRARANALVSGDADLHAIHDESWHIPILNPSEFADWLDKRAQNADPPH